MSVPAIANWLHDSVVSVFIDNMLWQAPDWPTFSTLLTCLTCAQPHAPSVLCCVLTGNPVHSLPSPRLLPQMVPVVASANYATYVAHMTSHLVGMQHADVT